MTLFQIVALYVALNLLIAPFLMFRVGGQRIAKKVNLGDGGDPILFARIRAHGNFTENAPLLLIGLLALAMVSNVHSFAIVPIVLHGFGLAITLGRIAHAFGMSEKGKSGKGRFIGTILTMLSYVGMAGTILFLIVAA
ncbi:MAPEG family protein [Fretibacter rubidus]|uniref:MAPEG family protein n=1 Tax=Fretibacter rubidus TaxID=570162 RepID=UPI00352AB19E